MVSQAALNRLDDPLVNGIEIKTSSILKAGLGAYTTYPLPIHTLLGLYRGEVLSSAQVLERYPTGHGDYLMHVRGDVFHDARDPNQSNWLRYINSPYKTGKPPNCRVEDGVIRTIRHIRSNTELTYAYGRNYKWGP